MHTEQEAREKWCPFAGGSILCEGEAEAEYIKARVEDFPCIASDCMAWEWGSVEVTTVNNAITKVIPKSELGQCGLTRR